jgi:preprotein translocase subunit SecD
MQIKTPKKFSKLPNDVSVENIVVNRIEDMTGAHITQAMARLGQDGRWEIEVLFDAAGAVEFSLLTDANLHKRMAIILDNEAKSAPTIQSRIEGRCQITGNFTKDEAAKLAAVLTAGSLPAEVRLESEFYVGPSLGAEQIQSGMLATAIATVVVIAFMLVYYRLAGAIAALCMLLNLPMLLGMMGFFKATPALCSRSAWPWTPTS